MIDNKPRDTCACWKGKKVMSKYCIKCSADINRIRTIIKTGSKEKSQEAEIKLKDLLELYK